MAGVCPPANWSRSRSSIEALEFFVVVFDLSFETLLLVLHKLQLAFSFVKFFDSFLFGLFVL